MAETPSFEVWVREYLVDYLEQAKKNRQEFLAPYKKRFDAAEKEND